MKSISATSALILSAARRVTSTSIIIPSFLWWAGCGASLVATVYKQVEEWILIAIVLQSLTPIEVASIPLKVFVPIGTGKAFVLVHLPLPSLRGGLSGAEGASHALDCVESLLSIVVSAGHIGL